MLIPGCRPPVENLRAGRLKQLHAVVTYDTLHTTLRVQTEPASFSCSKNLVGNALHYRRDDAPRVHISVKKEEAQWRFSCEDNGVGIAPEHQVRVFEAFKRLHGADKPGSGIGLAICKKIVEHYKGRIWVESVPDHGSTFFFTLPANDSM